MHRRFDLKDIEFAFSLFCEVRVAEVKSLVVSAHPSCWNVSRWSIKPSCKLTWSLWFQVKVTNLALFSETSSEPVSAHQTVCSSAESVNLSRWVDFSISTSVRVAVCPQLVEPWDTWVGVVLVQNIKAESESYFTVVLCLRWAIFPLSYFSSKTEIAVSLISSFSACTAVQRRRIQCKLDTILRFLYKSTVSSVLDFI